MIVVASLRKIYGKCASHNWLGLALCLAIGAAISVAKGQDDNWDLRNYHLSTALAFLRGTLDADFMMSGLQSYFNPVLDIPYAYLAVGPWAAYPRLLAGFMGLWYGGLVFVTFRIAAILLASLSMPKMSMWFGTIVAVTGAATYSQIGTTMNEIQVALFVLWGFLIVLKTVSVEANNDAGFAKGITLAGLLFGLAAGLKLTVCMYAFAVCVAMLGVFPFLAGVRACLIFSGGWIIGFMPLFIWWGAQVWARFESPVFPLFNGIFKSPFYPPQSFFDTRFFPHDWAQWLFYPYYWATSPSSLISELPFQDPRLALAMTVFILFGVTCVRRKKRTVFLDAPQRLTLLFAVASYIVWLYTTSILRYAVVIEILSVLAALSLIPVFVRGLPNAQWRRHAALGIGALFCGICLLQTRAMDWGHIPFGKTMFDVDLTDTQPDTLFISITGPTAYLSAFVPPDRHARFVGLSHTTVEAKGWPLADESKEIITAHQGPIVVLVPYDMADFVKNLPLIGLSETVANCHVVRSNVDALYGAPIAACAAHKIEQPVTDQ